MTFRDPIIKSAKPRDRIKYWNIVPGDQVRIRGEESKTIYEVMSINRLSNQVRLKVPSSVSEITVSILLFYADVNFVLKSEKAVAKKVQYANLQLLVGHHAFPPEEGTSEPVTAPYTSQFHSYFQKLDVFVVGSLPRGCPLRSPPGTTSSRGGTGSGSPQTLSLVSVARHPPTASASPGQCPFLGNGVLVSPHPWMLEISKLMPLIVGLYDTPEDVVAKVTYIPPALPANAKVPAYAPPSEQAYIEYLSSSSTSSFSPAGPMEVNLVKEVSNPHSRAKKQRRWQERQRHKKALLEEYIKAELKDLQGRTRREARTEATFKWEQRIEADRKAELQRRWQLRGQEAKLLRKRIRTARKEAKRNQKLADLVLEQGQNQVVPA